MQPYLEKIIHPSQIGFMHNRNIASNFRKIIDIAKYAEQEDLQAVVISLDFEKAFDSVEKTAIQGTMHLLNFSQYFIDLINLLYHHFEACVMNLGFASEWFKPTRALHQGCPMSSVIFVCIVELLGQQIRDNTDIRIEDIVYKSIQFADDMNLSQYFRKKSFKVPSASLKFFKPMQVLN